MVLYCRDAIFHFLFTKYATSLADAKKRENLCEKFLYEIFEPENDSRPVFARKCLAKAKGYCVRGFIRRLFCWL